MPLDPRQSQIDFVLISSRQHIREAEEDLKEYGDTGKITPMHVDLSSFDSTDKVAHELAATLTRLDALVLNAGLGVGPYAASEDGIDTHFQVNVVSQHHLMMLLLPTLTKTESSRVVFQSSEFHRLGTGDVRFADMGEINRDVGPANLYNRTKLAQILLMSCLVRAKRQSKFGLSPGRPPYFICTHPGGVSTDQPKQAEEAYGTKGSIGVKMVRPFMKDPVKQGCRPALFAATSPEVVEGQGLDGKYIVPDRKVTDTSKNSKDEGLQDACLRLVEGCLVGKFGMERLGYPTLLA